MPDSLFPIFDAPMGGRPLLTVDEPTTPDTSPDITGRWRSACGATAQFGDYRPQQPGRCADFDGVNDYIVAPNTQVTDYPFTFALWVNSAAPTSSDVAIALSDDVTDAKHFALHHRTTNVWEIIRRNTTSYSNQFNNSPPLTAGEWAHITVSFPSATTAKLYHNGVFVEELTGLDSVPMNSDLNSVAFGTYRLPSAGLHWHGKLFDVRLYDSELSATQVETIYSSSRPGGRPQDYLYTSNLTGHWTLEYAPNDYTTTDIAFDSSGNGHHGAAPGTRPAISETSDVPFSWHNELGYTDLKSSYALDNLTNLANTSSWHVANAVAGGTSTLATGDLLGKTDVLKVTLASGSSGAANGVDMGGGKVTMLDGHAYMIKCAVWLSREIASGENIYIRYTDSDGSIINLGENDDSAVGQWFEYSGRIEQRSANTNTEVHIYAATAMTADIDVYVADIKLYDLGIATSGTTFDNLYPPGTLPHLDTDTTKDVLGNTMQYTGLVPRDAEHGSTNVAKFDTVNDVADTGQNVLDFDPTTGEMTVAFWFNASVMDAGHYIYFKRVSNTGTSTPGSTNGWGVFFNTSNTFKIVLDDGTKVDQYNSAVKLTDIDVWHHYAITVDGSNYRYYKDGFLIETRAHSMGDCSGPETLHVGYPPGTGALGGKMHDGRIYTTRLTDAQILQLARHENPDVALACHHTFEEGSGDTLYDVSGNGYHATVVGHTESTFWVQDDDVPSHNIAKGFSDPTASGTYRSTSNSDDLGFIAPDGTDLPGGTTNANAVWAMRFRTPVQGGVTYLLSQYDTTGVGHRSWALQFYEANKTVRVAGGSTGAGVSTENGPTDAVVIGQWHTAVCYFDSDDQLLGISVDGSNFNTQPTAFTSLYDCPYGLSFGCRTNGSDTDSVSEIDLDIDFAMIGAPAPASPDWDAIRDILYDANGVKYEDLTDAQKTTLGLSRWYDCDDFGKNLIDKHGGQHATASAPTPLIPALTDLSADAEGNTIARPAGNWHNGAETTLDFSGGVATPWSAQQYHGYVSTDGTLGLNIKPVLSSVTTSLSFYIKWKGFAPSDPRYLIDVANANPYDKRFLVAASSPHVWLFYDGASWFDSGVAVPNDGTFHEFLCTVSGTSGTMYLDGTEIYTFSPQSINWATEVVNAAGLFSTYALTTGEVTGDFARAVISDAAETPSTILTSASRVFDSAFNDPRTLLDDSGNGNHLAVPASGWTFPATSLPTDYQFNESLPTGMSKKVTEEGYEHTYCTSPKV